MRVRPDLMDVSAVTEGFRKVAVIRRDICIAMARIKGVTCRRVPSNWCTPAWNDVGHRCNRLSRIDSTPPRDNSHHSRCTSCTRRFHPHNRSSSCGHTFHNESWVREDTHHKLVDHSGDNIQPGDILGNTCCCTHCTASNHHNVLEMNTRSRRSWRTACTCRPCNPHKRPRVGR